MPSAGGMDASAVQRQGRQWRVGLRTSLRWARWDREGERDVRAGLRDRGPGAGPRGRISRKREDDVILQLLAAIMI